MLGKKISTVKARLHQPEEIDPDQMLTRVPLSAGTEVAKEGRVRDKDQLVDTGEVDLCPTSGLEPELTGPLVKLWPESVRHPNPTRPHWTEQPSRCT